MSYRTDLSLCKSEYQRPKIKFRNVWPTCTSANQWAQTIWQQTFLKFPLHNQDHHSHEVNDINCSDWHV